MKTPDANKCGLECIRTNVERICVKPEKGQCPRCEQLVGESLDHIQQLEANWQQVSKAMCGKENASLEEVLRAVSQVKSELEAVKLINDATQCRADALEDALKHQKKQYAKLLETASILSDVVDELEREVQEDA